jgi:hypothetical protein
MTALNLSFPNASSVVDIPTLFAYINSMSNGYFVIFGLATLWIITYIILKKQETRIVITTSSFITSLVAMLGFFAGIVNAGTVWVFVVTLLISIFVDRWKGGDEG